jgi:hypothetical protein
MMKLVKLLSEASSSKLEAPKKKDVYKSSVTLAGFSEMSYPPPQAYGPAVPYHHRQTTWSVNPRPSEILSLPSVMFFFFFLLLSLLITKPLVP